MTNNNFEHYYAVIMAGGGGTRLWPLSRQSRPKQMLSLFDERSLFQTSVQRLTGLFPPERIFVVTIKEQATALSNQVPEIPVENYIIEPEPRGTASVIGLAAVTLQYKDPQAVMAVLTSDHFIGNEEHFRELLSFGYQEAAEGFLVTLGIEPTFPATGFGYIQKGNLVSSDQGQKVFRVNAFIEKPSLERARRMLLEGGYSWNSGMFIWSASKILQEFKRLMPTLFQTLEIWNQSLRDNQQKMAFDRKWSDLKVETIDYGVMEKANDVVVIPVENLQWNDVGSWDTLYDLLPTDQHGNIVMGGAHIGVDTSDSLIYMNEEHRLIVTIGVEDLVVVDTGDVLLVCRKDQAQKVRLVVNQLKEKGQEFV